MNSAYDVGLTANGLSAASAVARGADGLGHARLRAGAVLVEAAVQDPRWTSYSSATLFLTRVALRLTEADQVDRSPATAAETAARLETVSPTANRASVA